MAHDPQEDEVDVSAVRAARAGDVDRVAALHQSHMSGGFLPLMGRPFLARLYRRMLRSRTAFVLVIDDDVRVVQGFVAGCTDTSALYRQFLVRDGLLAALTALPRVLRHPRRVVETLRYGQQRAEDSEGAELLAVAVDDAARGRGAGSELVQAFLRTAARRGARRAFVVVGAGNDAALRLYRRAGFAERHRLEVHRDVASMLLETHLNGEA